MTNDERDELLVELRSDIKWIKTWITEQNKYRLMVWGALIAAVLSLVSQA